MKKLFFSFLALCLTASAFTSEKQLAFPTAEGFGRYATGGRGGNVYYVTSLEDCSDDNLVEGTLRWALRSGDDSPRTILFRVCGTIKLTSVLKFAHPNVSILGQSAPGGGICVCGNRIYVCKNNVIIRHMRFRIGDILNSTDASINIENTRNVIIDHCSFSWSMEENITMYDNDSTTLQWCISSEGLYNSIHPKAPRGYGAQWGGEKSSFHHNLIAHCPKRTPQVYGVTNNKTNPEYGDFHVDQEMYNNVVYNYAGGESTYNGRLYAPNMPDAYVKINMINNYYKPGPCSKSSNNRFMTIYNYKPYDPANPGSKPEENSTGISKWYINGNKFEQNNCTKLGVPLATINTDNWYDANKNGAIKFKLSTINNTSIGGTNSVLDYKMDTPSVNSGINITSADQAYADVIAGAGCTLPRRDAVDVRVLAEAGGTRTPVYYGKNEKTKTPIIGIIDSQNDLMPAGTDSATWNAWPDLSMDDGEILPTDTDFDGMPDDYEILNSFNPNDSSDGSVIAANGYSNLENYLETLTAKPDPEIEPVTAIAQTLTQNQFELNTIGGKLAVSAADNINAVYVYTINGTLILRQTVEKTTTTVDMPNATNRGAYIVVVEFGNKTYAAKEIVW